MENLPPSAPRVLLINPDRRHSAGIEQALARVQCAFTHAAGSADALRLLRETPYSVVITDPETGIGEDIALVDELHRVRPGVRVIVLAPSGTPGELIAALRHRVFLCQVAPFNAGDIANFTLSAIAAPDSSAGIDVLSATCDWISLRMNSDTLNADRLIAFFEQLRIGMPHQPPEEMMIAFREILQNAIEHGAQNDPSKVIEIAAVRTARTYVFYVADPGKGFHRDNLPHSALSNSPDYPARHIEIREKCGMRPGGYGILVAGGFIDELIYNEIGNQVLLIKYISNPLLCEEEERAANRFQTDWITRGAPAD